MWVCDVFRLVCQANTKYFNVTKSHDFNQSCSASNLSKNIFGSELSVIWCWSLTFVSSEHFPSLPFLFAPCNYLHKKSPRREYKAAVAFNAACQNGRTPLAERCRPCGNLLPTKWFFNYLLHLPSIVKRPLKSRWLIIWLLFAYLLLCTTF